MNEDKKIKKPNMWRLIYPLLIASGAYIIADIVFGIIISFISVRDLGITTIEDFSYEQLYSLVESYLVEFSQYITMLQNAIVIVVGFLFIRKDKQLLAAAKAPTLVEGIAPTAAAPTTAAPTTAAPTKRPAVIFFFLAFILGIVAAITGNNLISISGLATLFEDTLNSLNDALYSGGIVVQIISVCILTPIAEEVIYRGLFYSRLRETSSKTYAIIISALIFALMHGNIPQGIYAFLLGIVFAFVMERYNTIVAPILVHMGANVFSVVATKYSIIDYINSSKTAEILYIAIPAVLVVILLWIISEKVGLDSSK